MNEETEVKPEEVVTNPEEVTTPDAAEVTKAE